ncbi:hypothetical protein WR25_14290 [Diploscapter pachys]|uniref:Uncharacterized protein n=1 Tax=Diploscapter pachys TaxID=2018661 RepID=A0A2A2KGW5_9BILA|nr:hypothetical protein WR25_14290 [Diploscapter pachys]
MITTPTPELLSSSFTLSEIDSPFLESVRAEIDSLGGVCLDRPKNYYQQLAENLHEAREDVRECVKTLQAGLKLDTIG